MRGFVIALALLACAAPASAEEPRRRTAVLDPKFAAGVDGAALQPLGGLVAVAVQRHSRGDVTSADDVRTMIGFERQKELLGCSDTSCLAEIGGALGVDELVTTEVGLLGTQYVVNLSRIDIKKARSISRSTRSAVGIDALVGVLDGAVAELYGTIAVPPAAVAELPAQDQSRVAPWVTTGLGVIALGAGGALYGLALAEADEPMLREDADALETRGNAGLGVLIGGAVLTAGGVAWLVAD